jgi:hypothetical protein
MGKVEKHNQNVILTLVDFPNAEKQEMNANEFAKVNILCTFI